MRRGRVGAKDEGGVCGMQVRGVDLAVAESGQGVPFVWGHGLLGSMAQEDEAGLLDWGEVARAAHVVRYDARGHGRSEASLDPDTYRWPELAADLLALADACGVQRTVWGGLSMGCATALHAAALDPSRVEALVLVAPPTAWRTRPRQARLYRMLAGLTERVGTGPFAWLASLGALAPRARHLKQLQHSVVRHLRRADRRVVACALRGAAASDLPEPEALRAVTAPALVLAWRGDPSHPLSSADQLAAILPAAELRVAGSLEEVRAWSSEIQHFLAGLRPPRPAAGAPPRA